MQLKCRNVHKWRKYRDVVIVHVPQGNKKLCVYCGIVIVFIYVYDT